MRDEFEKEIAVFFSDQVDRIAIPPIPAVLKARDGPRIFRGKRRKAAYVGYRPGTGTLRRSALKIAGAALVAAACIAVAPRGVSSPVAKGAASLFSDAGLRASISTAASEISSALGKSITKE